MSMCKSRQRQDLVSRVSEGVIVYIEIFGIERGGDWEIEGYPKKEQNSK